MPTRKVITKPRAARPAGKTAKSRADTPNPFAPVNWPVRKGQAVYYITNDLLVGGGALAEGTVHHYNPAVEGSFLITKGRPVVTIDPGEGGIGNSATVGIDDVADHTPEGRAKLEGVIRDRLLARAADFDRLARESRRAAELLTPPTIKPTRAKRP